MRIETFLDPFKDPLGAGFQSNQALLGLGSGGLTGVGLGNFGMFYGTEQDAWYAKMMSHCAPLSAFAESGIPGGLAFLTLWGYILRRLWRSRPAAGDAQANALRVALLASLVALLVANLFYDYLLRTFVWVLVGLAMCSVHLVAGGREPRGAA